MRRVVFILLAIALCGCKGSNTTLETDVAELIGKRLLFLDSINSDFFSGADFKIVNYIDTSGCEECKLHLFDWGRLQRILDTLNVNVKVCFVVWSKEIERIESLAAIHRFKNPIVVDTFGSFQNRYPIPTISSFKCCLVDSLNQVVLVGSPLYNDKLFKLYLKQFTNDLANKSEAE